MELKDITTDYCINIIMDIFQTYVDKGLIKDGKSITEISTIQFNSILSRFSGVFTNNGLLKSKYNKNIYNPESVAYTVDIYIDVMHMLNKHITLQSFMSFTGIRDYETMRRLMDGELNGESAHKIKRIIAESEADYLNLNTDKGGVNLITASNRLFGWNQDKNGSTISAPTYQVESRPILSLNDSNG